MGDLLGLLGQGLVVVFAGRIGVQAEIELVLPAKLETGLGQGVVADGCGRVALGDVGGVGGDLVGDDAFFHVVAVGQAQVLLGGHVAEHGGAEPADHGGADARGEVVVSRRDVGYQRPQGVEGSLVAVLQLLVHVLLDEMHGHVARTFDHNLHVVFPGDFGQFAQGLQLTELGFVVGVGDGARTQAVAQREGDVVLLHDLADVGEVLVEEALAVVGEAPLGHDGAAPGDDAGDAVGGQGHVLEANAGVDGEVVDALLGLLDERVAEDLPSEVFGLAVDLFQGLVDGHAAHRDRAVADDPLAGLVDVAAGGEVHDGVAAPAGGPGHLLDLFFDAGGHGGVADVGVDLHEEVPADDHRLRLGMVDVGRNDGAAGGHLIADELRSDDFGQVGAEIHGLLGTHQPGADVLLPAHVLADGDKFHLRGDYPLPGVVHLGDVLAGLGAAGVADVAEAVAIQRGIGQPLASVLGSEVGQLLGVAALLDPLLTQGGQALAHVYRDVGVGVGAGGVVDVNRRVLLDSVAGMGIRQGDLAHGHTDVGSASGLVDLAGVGEGPDGFRINLGLLAEIVLVNDGHVVVPPAG